MFPQTPHCELLIEFKRQEGWVPPPKEEKEPVEVQEEEESVEVKEEDAIKEESTAPKEPETDKPEL